MNPAPRIGLHWRIGVETWVRAANLIPVDTSGLKLYRVPLYTVRRGQSLNYLFGKFSASASFSGNECPPV
jgi:hypothetical protein